MEVVIEFYDKDVLKNIVAPLTLRPKKVIYFYDKGIRETIVFTALRTCLERNIAGVQVEFYPVDINSLDTIYQKVSNMIAWNKKASCCIELTGGSELMLLAGYRAAAEADIPIMYTDLIANTIIDLRYSSLVARTATLTLEDFVDAKGACFVGETHKAPVPARFGAIKEMARYLFRHIPEWKDTCNFLQTVASNLLPHEMFLNSKIDMHMKNGKRVSPSIPMLKEFERLGFITNLHVYEKRIHFAFATLEDRQYLISYGVWLELYVYIAAVETGEFHDVKLGTMIDWNAYDNITIAGNEIDVLLMDQSLPVFISCKIRDADTAALNELLIAKKRLGGWFSKGIIVAFGKEKKVQQGTYLRAQELGLELLDNTDILAEDFSARLLNAVRGNDLVSLKWKRV